MKKTLQLKTNEKPIKLLISVQASETLLFRGFDANEPTTFYFRRKKQVQGLETIEFPMPITPKVLVLEILCVEDFTLSQTKIVPLPTPKINVSPETYDFIRLAMDVSKKANTLQPGVYASDVYGVPIHVTNEIKNRDTGKTMNTPARVSRMSGQVEISKSKFKDFTVPMRMFVLLHERGHYDLNSSNETECDLQALRLYLALGFPKTEAAYACTKIFSGENPEHVTRTRQLMDFVNRFDVAKNQYDNGFC